jgi:hypothetical protein
MKFRKKPVVIEAWEVSELIDDAGNNWNHLPKPVIAAYDDGTIVFGNKHIQVRTLEGRMTAESTDYLIRGVQGELYPCKPDIFAATYEPVEEA